MRTKSKFQGNPLVEEGFALLGNGISELKFLFLFFGLAEKCFSRNSLIPLSLHARRSGGHRWEVVAMGGDTGVGDAEEARGMGGMRKGAGRGQGSSGGEAPESSAFLGGLQGAGAAWGASEALAPHASALGAALILTGAAAEGLAGF